MKMYDIVFLHPPQSFNKLKYPLSGAFGALVGSTDLLGHEPVGMISMAQDLSRSGYKTRIFNVGKMFLDLRYRGVPDIGPIRDFIKNLHAEIYAIGLHWAAHAPGAIELARLIKEYHPEAQVLLGGITATYYHKEIMEKFRFIDLVVLGEVDGFIHEIVESLLSGQPYGSIPNTCYRKNGKTVSTALKPPIKKNLLYIRGPGSELIEPNTGFSRGSQDPIRDCMIPLVHGCQQSCPFCGGSGYFYKKYFCRNRPDVMTAEDVVANIKHSVHQGAPGISLFGDARFLGDHYWRELTRMIAQEHLSFDLYLELFSPATETYMEAWRNVTSGNMVMALSPESSDMDVRQTLGKHYSNEDIVKQVASATDLGISLSLGFTFALPKQDFASIVRTQDFINDLCHRFNRLVSYMFEPFLFIDPGSLIFDSPEAYGYRLRDRTLEGLIEALNRPHWYYSLNYATEWMSKKEIIDAIFFVGSSRNELYMAFLGPSERNLFHQSLISQQKALVAALERSPHLGHEEVQDIIERTIDEPLRRMNISITAPDFDLVQQKPNDYSISGIFGNTARMIDKCHRETSGKKDLLSEFRGLGLFEQDIISVETYEDELIAAMESGSQIAQISIRPPKVVWKRFDQLLTNLGLSLEAGLLEEFVRYDWARFLVDLHAELCLKDWYNKGELPPDIRQSDLLLPLRNAYVKLNYKHDGKVVKKRHWLTLENGPTYIVISFMGVGHPVTRREFDFLKGCGLRISFLEFYKKASGFVEKPQDFLQWLLGEGLVLFAPADLG